MTVAFNEERFIKSCIKQFDGLDFLHLVLVSDRPWNGDWPSDKTANIADKAGAEVIVGYWPGQAEQFNFGLSTIFKDFDWVLIVDADEFYTKDGIEQLIFDLNTGADAVYAPNMKVFWKTPSYRIVPDQYDNPVIAVRPNKVRFSNKRSLDCIRSASQTTLYHLSYVRNNDEMLKKIDSFEHTKEFDTQKWYKDVWLKWHENNQDNPINLHPVVPEQFSNAIFDPVPEELRKLFEKNKLNF
jgi:hypothetical protein